MKTVRKLVYTTVIRHVALVTLAFLALFFFIDFVDQAKHIGRRGYTVLDVVWTCLLMQGGHFYNLFPIALLIGAILALARMAQTSEFTILRTGGLGPGRALMLLGGLGVSAAMLGALAGNWLVPLAEAELATHRAQFSRNPGLKLGDGGTWLREQRVDAGGQRRVVTVNVGSASSHGTFERVRIYEFDQNGRLLRRLTADSAHVRAAGSGGAAGSVWQLQGVRDTRWRNDVTMAATDLSQPLGTQLVEDMKLPQLDWASSLTPLVVSASVLPPDTMPAWDLRRYANHLSLNAQAAQKYEMAFWQKSLYPLVCLVMVGLSLPFAYLHARSGGMSLKIFGGIVLGISFVLVNHIASHLGLLHQWQPWLATTVPSLLYLLLSLGAFAWLVRYR
jgi:lipopolysaccharide export system permease protein